MDQCSASVSILFLLNYILVGDKMESVTISKTEYEELLKYKYIMNIVEEELHERPMKENFIKKTEELRKEMEKGKKVSFSSVDEMDRAIKESG